MSTLPYESQHDESVAELKDLRILVAEENPVTQRVLSNMLLYCGHKPSLFAETPESVLENLQNDEIDLALLNWNIVSANDFSLLKEVQQKKVFESLPLMIMIPGMDEELIAIASKFGARSYIPKPIPAHLLPEKIEEAVLASTKVVKLRGRGNADAPRTCPPAQVSEKLEPFPSAGNGTAPSHMGNGTTPRRPDALSNAEATARAKQLYAEGRNALGNRQFANAATAFAQALELKPYFAEACKGLGLAYRGLRDTGKARHFCNKAALIYVRAGRFQDAEKFHSELTRAGLKPLNPFKALGDMHKTRGNTAKALELYEHGASITPEDPAIAYNLFTLHRKLKQNRKAVLTLSRLLEASKNVKDRRNLQWSESAYYKLTGQEWGGNGAPAPVALVQAGESRVDVESSGPTILIVDDEPHIRMLLERSLETLEDDGASLLFAVDGEEGLQLVKDKRPELVFLDVMMPKMNGFDVCRIIKNDLGLNDVYIIMLTAKGQEFDRKKGLESGADVYMTKPFRPQELANLARAVLDM